MAESSDSERIEGLRSDSEQAAEELRKRPGRKEEARRGAQRRRAVNPYTYLDAEAEVSSGEEEEDSEDAEQLKSLYRQKREDWRERFNVSEEQLLEHYKDLEREQAEEELGEEESALLPSLRDPALFRVRCRRGREREAVVRLLSKFFDLQGQPGALSIFSVSALDKFAGFIFVEAAKALHVKEAVSGLSDFNAESIMQVRLNEIKQVFAPDPGREIHVAPFSFVQMGSGMYQGDLALVLAVDEDTNLAAHVKLVPRLPPPDAPADPTARPAPALFDPEVHPAAVLVDNKNFARKTYSYVRQTFQNGFLLKRVRLAGLRQDIPVPPLADIKVFLDSEEEEQRRAILARLAEQAEKRRLRERNLAVGDRVAVVRGDLVGLQGAVIEVSGELAKVELASAEVREPVTFRQVELNKLFEIGDAVEIVSGPQAGGRGTVVRIDRGQASVVSHSHSEEFLVDICDIQRAEKGAALQPSLVKRAGQIRVGDLVTLADGMTVALVTGLDRDSFVLVDVNGLQQTVGRAEVYGRVPPGACAKNCFDQDIGPRCSVKVRAGPNRDVRALVKGVSGSVAFLQDPSREPLHQLFVEDVNNCYLIDSYEYDRTQFNGRLNNPHTALPPQEERRQSAQAVRSALVGQKKKIVRGEWKGYEGVVRSIVGESVKFELSARSKVVTVPISSLNIVIEQREGARAGERQGAEQMLSPTYAPHMSTPAYDPEMRY